MRIAGSIKFMMNACIEVIFTIYCFLQFVEKAPEDVVRGVREKAAEAEEKITLTKYRLEFLKHNVPISK